MAHALVQTETRTTLNLGNGIRTFQRAVVESNVIEYGMNESSEIVRGVVCGKHFKIDRQTPRLCMMTSTYGNILISALLDLCAGNTLVTGEFPSQMPVTRSFDVLFDLSLNKRLSKQSERW